MPSPNKSLSTLRPDLAEGLEEFDVESDRLGFIGYQLLPILDVEQQSGWFGRIPLAELLRNVDALRASQGGYATIDWQFADDQFTTREYGVQAPVDRRNAARFANYFDCEMIAGKLARDATMRAAELRVAAAIFNTTTFGTTAAGTTWATAATATPIANVESAKNAIYDATGLWPNCVAMHRKVFNWARRTAEVKDAISSNGASGESYIARRVTAAMLAEVFDVDRVLVCGGSYNSAGEGLAASIAGIYPVNQVWVGRVADTASMAEPCVGRTFHWSADGSQPGGLFESYEDPGTRRDMVRCRHEVHEKILISGLGRVITGI